MRIAKRVGSGVVQGFLYEPGTMGPIAETTGDSQIRSRFIYATRTNVPDVMEKAGRTYRIATDDHGSPRAVIDTQDGSVAQRLDYDAFGNVTRDTNPGFQPFGYAGGLYDPDTKLVHFGQRDYDPQTGRWTQRDPLGFSAGDPNLYGYVLNDPVNATDPTGLFYCELPGTDAGTDAAEYWADKANHATNPCEEVAADVMGSLAELWTPENACDTLITLAGAGATGLATRAVAAGGRAIAAAAAGEETAGAAEAASSTGRVGRALQAAKRRLLDETGSVEIRTRKAPGGDGATSRHLIERRNGEAISRTHQVEKDGDVIHQHQEHIGKHGTERSFPDKWVQYPRVNAP